MLLAPDMSRQLNLLGLKKDSQNRLVIRFFCKSAVIASDCSQPLGFVLSSQLFAILAGRATMLTATHLH
jgi:hypothetical protein